MVMEDLKRELETVAGQPVADLQGVYDRHSEDPALATELVSFLVDPELQKPASWLLRRSLEAGQTLSVTEARPLFRSLSGLKDWETRLQILQSLPYLTIGKRDDKPLEAFLHDCLAGENKFVRAWAYNGFHELALQHEQFRAEVDQLLAQALEDGAASIKARVRNILKQKLKHQE
ncbi:hypothetical protein Pan153_15450 [Gimesia panareensis]|uniref:HEAT repeat protein n=1 Tax=Gimesia panareensis TaxID=2527978 RepID=A0A518FKN9_9PLAN|nr:hypothetical protein [Gimesia panareensis]QDV16911.1 hypothetical protein Pan153_15450 [Gimesia panareensis]